MKNFATSVSISQGNSVCVAKKLDKLKKAAVLATAFATAGCSNNYVNGFAQTSPAASVMDSYVDVASRTLRQQIPGQSSDRAYQMLRHAHVNNPEQMADVYAHMGQRVVSECGGRRIDSCAHNHPLRRDALVLFTTYMMDRHLREWSRTREDRVRYNLSVNPYFVDARARWGSMSEGQRLDVLHEIGREYDRVYTADGFRMRSGGVSTFTAAGSHVGARFNYRTRVSEFNTSQLGNFDVVTGLMKHEYGGHGVDGALMDALDTPSGLAYLRANNLEAGARILLAARDRLQANVYTDAGTNRINFAIYSYTITENRARIIEQDAQYIGSGRTGVPALSGLSAR